MSLSPVPCSSLFSSAAPLTGPFHPFNSPPPSSSSCSPSILQRGTTCTNLPPGAGLFPHSPFTFVHKKNTGSSSLCFSFSFCFCCRGVSDRSALLAFFYVSVPLNKTSFYFIHRKTHTHKTLGTTACASTSSVTLLFFIFSKSFFLFYHFFPLSFSNLPYKHYKPYSIEMLPWLQRIMHGPEKGYMF